MSSLSLVHSITVGGGLPFEKWGMCAANAVLFGTLKLSIDSHEPRGEFLRVMTPRSQAVNQIAGEEAIVKFFIRRGERDPIAHKGRGCCQWKREVVVGKHGDEGFADVGAQLAHVFADRVTIGFAGL